MIDMLSKIYAMSLLIQSTSFILIESLLDVPKKCLIKIGRKMNWLNDSMPFMMAVISDNQNNQFRISTDKYQSQGNSVREINF